MKQGRPAMIELRPIRGGDVSVQDRRGEAEAETSACRALVAVSPVKPRETLRQAPAARASAAFLAHLIATAEGLPQTREKRRLEPQEAVRLYGAAQDAVQLRRARLASL
jgi:hypothetical protein